MNYLDDYIEIKASPKKKPNWLTIIPLSLLAVFVAFQLFVLSNVGDKGEKITALKRMQSNLQIENEIYRAKIMELQTSQSVVVPLSEMVKVEKKSVNIIDIGTANDVSAMR